jgi:putative phosphoribosyl transferase
MPLFKNRLEAAHELAQHLAYLKDEKPIVLGLAPGGVPVADVIARLLDAPMDVLLIEKLYAPGISGSPGSSGPGASVPGAPGTSAPAPGSSMANQVVGAVDEHGRISMIQSTARWHHLTSQQMVEPARLAFRELQRIQSRVRSVLSEVDVRGKTVIVVGQGVATGAKMLGAIASLRDRGAAKIIAAAPAGTSQATWQLHENADIVVIPHRPAKFRDIKAFYEEFTEVTPDDLMAIVEKWVKDKPAGETGMKTIVTKLTSSKGHALFVELDLPPGASRGSGPYPVVVFAHGAESSCRSTRNVSISHRIAKRGIIGARVDFTGHGRSEGTPQDATDEQMMADLHTMMRAAVQLSEVDPHRIGLVGSGTGGLIALHYAAQIHDLKALVVRGPVCGRETVAARMVKAPTLIIHAEQDTALLDAAETLDREMTAPHELLRIANCNRLFNDPVSLELMVNATVDWLVDHLLIPASEDRLVSIARDKHAEPTEHATAQ